MPHPTCAMVLAAGLGKRMRPITDRIPKPMVEVAGRMLIDRALDKLQQAGVEKAIINTHYKAELLAAHIEKRRSELAMELIISYEDTLLETGGGVAKALPYIGDEPFYVINSDIMWLDGDIPALNRLADSWDGSQMDALLLVNKVASAVGYDGKGDFDLREGGVLERTDSRHFPYVFTGLQILSPALFTDIPSGAFSLNVLYGRARAASGVLNRIGGLEHTGDWLHIGTPEGVALAEAFLKKRS
jgi:N-acetyl-alpha-D-muramate 1-phosphate uridylyltransferase